MADGVLQGFSQVLNLHIRWENGQLRWHDPETGRQISNLDDEREARIRAQEEARLERETRLLAETRVRELEQRLRDLGDG